MTDPDLKPQLDRLGERIPPAPDAFEALRRRRTRHDRNRRLGTIALAFAVALAGTWGAFATFGGRGTGPGPADTSTSRPAAWVPPSVPTLWPESWTDTPELPTPADVQAQADAGDASVSWRLDSKTVAQRFVTQVLQWDAVGTVDLTPLVPGPDGEARYRASCGDGCLAGPAVLFLAQPARQGSGGIWDVSAVVDDHVSIGFTGPLPGDGHPATVASGASMRAVLQIRDGGLIGTAGIVSTDGCATSTTTSGPLDQSHTPWDTAIHGPIDPSPGTETVPCGDTSSAFLYGYIKSGEGGAGSGDLLDPSLGILYDLTAIAVKIAPSELPSPSPVPASGQIPAASDSVGPAACGQAPPTDTRTIVAKNIGWNLDCWHAPADTSLSVTYDDRDGGVPNLFAILPAGSCEAKSILGSGASCPGNPPPIFEGTIITGRDHVVFDIGRLAAGSYLMFDEVHPTSSHAWLTVG